MLSQRMNTCLHCRRWRYIQCRGLCKRCYDNDAIRAQYPPLRTSSYQDSQVPIQGRRRPQPTTHLPGSPGKVEVLAARAAGGEQLWHEQDARAEVS